jgi:hypothetical protein
MVGKNILTKYIYLARTVYATGRWAGSMAALPGICVKFCFKLGETASETHEMLKTAFGDDAMGRTQTFEWFSRFKRGETSVKDSEHSGRLSTGRTDGNVENVRKIVNEDRRNTITETTGRLDLSYGTWKRILRT